MFKELCTIFLTTLVATLPLASAADTTIILQNGLDDYTGCEDSYVYTVYGMGTENFGDLEELKVHRESC